MVEGDALTRYRLGLASHLGRDSGLKAAGLPGRPVVVELMIVLAAGKVIGVEVVDDGGFATLAARAADRVRQASRSVPVPPELRESPLRVSLGVAFEP